MKRTLLVVLLALLLPLSAQAGTKLINMPPAPGTVFPTPSLESPTITGPLVLKETPAAALSAQTCAEWGLTTPVGAWSCTDDPLTITRTASGANLALTYSGTQTVVPGATYGILATYTITAGSFSSAIGGRIGRAQSATVTLREYFPATTDGKHIITVTAASAGTITGISVNAITNTVSASEGPIVSTANLESAGNQSGAVDIVTGTKAGGILSIRDFIDAGTGGSTRYAFRVFSGATQIVSLNATDGGMILGGVTSNSTFTSTRTSLSSPAFYHTGTATSWGATFRDSGTVGIMNGSDTLNIFDAAITNSNHTGSSNFVNAFNAGNITGDAEASEYGINIGTGWDAPVALAEATANGSVATAISSVGPTGAQTTIQGWIRVDVAGTPRYVPFW